MGNSGRQVPLLLAVGPDFDSGSGFLVLNSINRWRRNGNDAGPQLPDAPQLADRGKGSWWSTPPSSIVGCDWKLI